MLWTLLPNLSLCHSALNDLAFQDARNADVVIVALGESNHSSGEAKSVADIVLPAGQIETLRHLKRFGKKIVTLVCAGRSLAIEEVVALSDAVLYCWQGGVEAGSAIADVLCGMVTPGGRLPVTLPRHTGQIPLYYNHKSNGRAIDEYYGDIDYPNYVDMPGSPLYPFGYGLSYTRFAYSEPQCVTDSAQRTVTASVKVTNAGARAGTEVVQCYVQDRVCSVTLPVRQLKAYRKIQLLPGESTTVSFTLSEQDLSFYQKSGEFGFEHGDFLLWLGCDCLSGQRQSFCL